MKVSFVSSQAISQAMRYQMARMQADLVTANKEVVTWQVADRGLALGARTGVAVSMHRELDRLQGLTDSNQVALTRLSSTQDILQKVTDNANQFMSAMTTALSTSSDGKIARFEAESFLSAMIGDLNRDLNGDHLFSGINTDVTPINDFSDPTSPNRVAFEAAFVARFTFAPDDPLVSTISDVDMQDFIANDVMPQFMGAGWETNWSNAADQQIVSRITLTETAQTSVSANISPFRKLAMASSMISSMLGQGMARTTEAVILEEAISLIGDSITELANQQGYTGVVEQRIERANERMSMQKDLMTQSLTDMEGVDENEAAVRVNGLLAQIELSYTLTSRMQQLSLLKYL